MDVKLKSEVDFEKYYQSEYKNEISSYYENLKDKKKFNIILSSVFAIVISIVSVLAIDVLNLKELLNNKFSIVVSIYFIILLLGTIFAIYNSLKREMLKINEDIIKDILAFISDNPQNEVTFEPKLMLSKDALDKMELFNLDVVKYTGKNYIKVKYNNNMMVFSDMNTYVYDITEIKKEIYKNGKKYIRTIKRKKKRIIYDGMYIGATLNKKNTNHIYLIPNNLNDRVLQSKIMSYIKFHGVPVMLENLDFSKKYKVFCDDEVQARYILSLSLMERINDIDKEFKGKKYIVFKEGKRFAICIEGLSIEQIKNITLPPFRKENQELKILNDIFDRLNKMFKIYHILDLGNDLYTKHLNKPTQKKVIEKKEENIPIDTIKEKLAEVTKKQESESKQVSTKEITANEPNTQNKTITKDEFMSGWYN